MDEEVSLNHIKILVQYAQHAPQEHWEEWIQQTEKRKHFFDLIGDNIPQILHSPFNIIPDLAQFFIEEFNLSQNQDRWRGDGRGAKTIGKRAGRRYRQCLSYSFSQMSSQSVCVRVCF